MCGIIFSVPKSMVIIVCLPSAQLMMVSQWLKFVIWEARRRRDVWMGSFVAGIKIQMFGFRSIFVMRRPAIPWSTNTTLCY